MMSFSLLKAAGDGKQLSSSEKWKVIYFFLFIFVLDENGRAMLDRKPVHCLWDKLMVCMISTPPRVMMVLPHHRQIQCSCG